LKEWQEIFKDKGDPNTILVADSYYLDSIGRKILQDMGIKYICAVQASRFRKICDLLIPLVSRPGQWHGAWNETTKELFVYHWSPDTKVGKKFVITNAVQHLRKRPSKYMIPAYDVYKILFSLRDKFNRRLHDHCWPHKHGKGTTTGDKLSINDFYFSCILQNVNNAFVDLQGDGVEEDTFEQFCIGLADELYEYASTVSDKRL